MRSVPLFCLPTLILLLLGITASDHPAIARRQAKRQDLVVRASRTRPKRQTMASCLPGEFYLRLSSPATSFAQLDPSTAMTTQYFKPTTSVTTATRFILTANGNIQVSGSPNVLWKVQSTPSYVAGCASGPCKSAFFPLYCSINFLSRLECVSPTDGAAPIPNFQTCPTRSPNGFTWNRGPLFPECVIQYFTAVPVCS